MTLWDLRGKSVRFILRSGDNDYSETGLVEDIDINFVYLDGGRGLKIIDIIKWNQLKDKEVTCSQCGLFNYYHTNRPKTCSQCGTPISKTIAKFTKFKAAKPEKI